MSGIIDFHAHLGKVIYGYPPLTVEKLLRFMDDHDIEWSVVLPLVHPEEEDYYYTTEQALADCARRESPGRVPGQCRTDIGSGNRLKRRIVKHMETATQAHLSKTVAAMTAKPHSGKMIEYTLELLPGSSTE